MAESLDITLFQGSIPSSFSFDSGELDANGLEQIERFTEYLLGKNPGLKPERVLSLAVNEGVILLEHAKAFEQHFLVIIEDCRQILQFSETQQSALGESMKGASVNQLLDFFKKHYSEMVFMAQAKSLLPRSLDLLRTVYEHSDLSDWGSAEITEAISSLGYSDRIKELIEDSLINDDEDFLHRDLTAHPDNRRLVLMQKNSSDSSDDICEKIDSKLRSMYPQLEFFETSFDSFEKSYQINFKGLEEKK